MGSSPLWWAEPFCGSWGLGDGLIFTVGRNMHEFSWNGVGSAENYIATLPAVIHVPLCLSGSGACVWYGNEDRSLRGQLL